MAKNYKCQNCGKELTVENDQIPSCCDKPMKQLSLDVCTQPTHAEHARPMGNDEPCDDGRAG